MPNTINKKLLDLYESNYPLLSEKLVEKNINLSKENQKPERGTNPLLLKIDKNYIEADIKIMIFGQETNVWLGEKNEGAFLGEIKPVIDIYQGFYLNNYCYKYGGQFWNGIKKFKELLQKEFPNKKISFVWNNVVKIGKIGKGFPHKINHITNNTFNIATKEISIVKPDYLVFFSGPNYDNEIKKQFGEIKKQSVSEYNARQLCVIENENIPFSLRTYHPNYLCRQGKDKYHKYLSTLVSEIKKRNGNKT